MNVENPVTQAIHAAGSASSLARKLEVTPGAILKWRNAWDAGNRRAVPASRAIEIEKAVGVSRWILRPDLWGGNEGEKSSSETAKAA